MGKVWALAAGVDESRHSKTISWCVNFLAARDAKPVTSQSRVDSNWTGSDAVPSDGIDEVCCNDADGARMARIRVWTRTIDSSSARLDHMRYHILQRAFIRRARELVPQLGHLRS
ncbi:conserved hypothetical protein [Coccidioides posadasii str. Silveira]|uniref:Uncharacterized protein n=1 Tax=Coccidioides posadasii (strain RMSCC 757 / Silveira) TaxID=443226 RepID=E9DI04_COCPS|nr:conserved hypothetical protein [Coccidioides posadasii str. Silveira]